VVVCDAGRPRNAAARRLNGYLTRDGIPPLELLRLGRRELRRYGVHVRKGMVTRAVRTTGGFMVTLGGRRLRGRRLLLATGVRDRIPPWPGIEECYGWSVHHCPYCDGWEARSRRLAVHGRGTAGVRLALNLLSWSRDVALCTDGPTRLSPAMKRALLERGITLHSRRIERLHGHGRRLRAIVFRDGTELARDALFLAAGHEQASGLALDLGCRILRTGAVWTDRTEWTGVRGIYAVGDASRDVQFAVVAAAEGARAAVAIHKELMREDLLVSGRRARAPRHLTRRTPGLDPRPGSQRPRLHRS
jgi:thioredoxin reductase